MKPICRAKSPVQAGHANSFSNTSQHTPRVPGFGGALFVVRQSRQKPGAGGVGPRAWGREQGGGSPPAFPIFGKFRQNHYGQNDCFSGHQWTRVFLPRENAGNTKEILEFSEIFCGNPFFCRAEQPILFKLIPYQAGKAARPTCAESTKQLSHGQRPGIGRSIKIRVLKGHHNNPPFVLSLIRLCSRFLNHEILEPHENRFFGKKWVTKSREGAGVAEALRPGFQSLETSSGWNLPPTADPADSSPHRNPFPSRGCRSRSP